MIKKFSSRIFVVFLILAIVTLSSFALWWPPKQVQATTTVNYYTDSDDDDSYIWKEDGDSWSDAHDATSGTLRDSDGTVIVSVANNYASSGVYRICRGFHVFDTSSLPNDAYIVSATFYFYVDVLACTTNVNQKMFLIGGSDSYPSEPNAAGDFDRSLYSWTNAGSSLWVTHNTDPAMTVDAWNSISLNATGLSYINKTGNTRLCTALTYDCIDSEPENTKRCIVEYDAADTSNDPYLAVEYITLPTVTSSAATSVSTTTATANGNITGLGGDAHCDYRGFVYGTTSKSDPGNVSPVTSNPYDSYTLEGLGEYGTGAFTGSLSSLSPNQTYYYRSWTSNTAGVDYSDTEQSFHTFKLPSITISAASSITNKTARLNGNITDAGYLNPTVTVYWGDNDGGTTPGLWDYSDSPTSPGQPQGVASFYKDISSLSPGITYYFIAKAVNDAGTVWASSTLSFSTTNVFSTVITNAATGTDNVSSTMNGDITSTGGDSSCNYRGFVWGTISYDDPGNTTPSVTSYSSYWTESGSFSTGAFTHGVSLIPKTVYYARACSHNSSGWSYGSQVTFFTEGIPDVTNQAATSVTINSATLNANITSIWGDTVTTRGFQYGLTVGYGLTCSESGSFSTGVFNLPVSGLSAGQHYHFRAFATNGYGTAYGSDLYLTTLPGDPSGLTSSSITFISFDLTWTMGTNAARTAVVYANNDFPASPGAGTIGYFGINPFTTLTDLTPGLTYYVRIWSWVSGSDVWSAGYDDLTVTLGTPAPTNFKAIADFDDGNRMIHFWWNVPSGMTSDPDIHTIIHGKIGSYPTSPTDNAAISIYNELTGDPQVYCYDWSDNVQSGTPYFFSIWFYNAGSDNYTIPENAAVTTPAVASMFNFPDPADSDFSNASTGHITGMPGFDIGAWIASTMGMDNANWYLLVVLIGTAVVSVAVAILSNGSILLTGAITAAMYFFLIWFIALPFWWAFVYILLAISVAWIKGGSTSY